MGALLLLCASSYLCIRGLFEPKSHGKTAARWFQEFRAAKAKHQVKGPVVFISVNGRTLPSQTYSIDQFALEHDPSAEALRALGTQAALFLAGQVKRKDNPLALAYTKTVWSLPGWLRKLAPPSPILRSEIRVDACRALQTLGKDANPAVPALLQALKFGDLYSEGAILETLRALPCQPEQVDPVLLYLAQHQQLSAAVRVIIRLSTRTPTASRLLYEGLSSPDPQTRRDCASELGYFAADGALVSLKLAAALSDSDPHVRYEAARSLEKFGPAAAAALDALSSALNSGDGELRYAAARVLGAMGTNALPAMPVLLKATNDSSVLVRSAAAQALRGLPPSIHFPDRKGNE